MKRAIPQIAAFLADTPTRTDQPSVTMAQVLLDLITSLGNCLNCFPGSPTLKINSRSFKILRLLGEVC